MIGKYQGTLVRISADVRNNMWWPSDRIPRVIDVCSTATAPHSATLTGKRARKRVSDYSNCDLSATPPFPSTFLGRESEVWTAINDYYAIWLMEKRGVSWYTHWTGWLIENFSMSAGRYQISGLDIWWLEIIMRCLDKLEKSSGLGDLFPRRHHPPTCFNIGAAELNPWSCNTWKHLKKLVWWWG